MKQDFVEDNIIILSKQTLDKMLEDEYPSDLIGLYCFYYYTAKWQKTNIIKCSTNYVSKGLKWTKDRVINNKKKLKEIDLIEDKITKNKKGQITGWYIKVKYIWKKETIKTQRVAEPESGLTHPVANSDTNALSVNNINALSVSKENEQNEVLRITFKKEIDTLIEKFKSVNPTYERLFGNTTQRAALERLVKKFGKEKVENMIAYLPKTNQEQFAPVIITPLQLEQKLGQLVAFLQKGRSEKINIVI